MEKTDANTRAVFGDYISVYDIQRAVVDGATVPIYYESRLAKLELKESERPKIDPEFEEATEGEEVERREKLKSRWAQLEAVVGSENRVKLVARDLVEHFESRLATMDGKAMVVVMSRRIAVALYRELVALRPAWHGEDDEHGALKVVMTGSASDPLDWQPHILAQADGKARLLRAVTELSQGFALAVPHAEALRIRDDVGFFQAVRAVLAKSIPGERKTDEELDLAIRQIISRAVVSDEVVDIFAAAGLKKPDISILSDEFLSEVRGMPQRNLAVELLQKLLKGEIKARGKRNVVQAKSFADMLEQTIRRYQNRAIEAAQVIEELIQLAKDMRAANARGEALELTEDELAFYDALEVNDSAVKVLGEPTRVKIARELVDTVKKTVTIDW
ncbi:MAG: DUF3387 domain-containing protein, partial [Geothrix sp.]|nr:DUF3387 domain-containing protein [Geothrix sp.]